MQCYRVSYEKLVKFCHHVFKGHSFIEEQSTQITDVLLAADLSGIQSHGKFGNKAEIEASLSKYLQEDRDSAKAEGQDRIYIHGEKEAQSEVWVRSEGVSLNDKTYAEMQMIAEYTGAVAYLPEYLD